MAKSISNYVAYLLDGRTLQRSNGAGAGGVPWPIHYTHRQRSVINIPIIVYSASHQMATNENLLMCPHRKRYAATHTHTHTQHNTTPHSATHTPTWHLWDVSCNWRSSFYPSFFSNKTKEALCRHKYSWSTKRVLLRILSILLWSRIQDGAVGIGTSVVGKWRESYLCLVNCHPVTKKCNMQYAVVSRSICSIVSVRSV